MDVYKLIKPNIDVNGMIAQTDGDGGDTAQREGMVLLAVAYMHQQLGMHYNIFQALRWRGLLNFGKLVSDWGLLRRHVDTTKWYGNWDRGSRDQYHASIGLMAAGATRMVKNIICGFFVRAGFCCNIRANTSDHRRIKLPDFIGLSLAGAFLRNLPFSLMMYPIQLLLDLDLLVNSIIWRVWRSKNKEDSDILNHLQCLVWSDMKNSTFISRLAIKIFAKIKPMNDSKVNVVQQRLDHYFRPETGGVTGMAEVYKYIVVNVFYVEY